LALDIGLSIGKQKEKENAFSNAENSSVSSDGFRQHCLITHDKTERITPKQNSSRKLVVVALP